MQNNYNEEHRKCVKKFKDNDSTSKEKAKNWMLWYTTCKLN